MFSPVMQSLLSGQFICQVTDHPGFIYLNDPVNKKEVNSYASKIGLHLAETNQNGAFFLAHDDDGSMDRRAVRETFTEIKQSLRPLVSFLDMVMRAMQDDNLMTVGAPIEVNKLMGAIDANPSYRNDLQTLGIQLKIQADGTDRNRLDKVLKIFREKGYLALSNPEREIYQITGKIEFIQEVIAFLMNHDSIGETEEGTLPMQGVLV